MLKGILIGAGNAFVLALIFILSTLVRRSQSTIDIRGLRGNVIPFFSGLGIGFFITMTCVVGAIYALVRYVQHAGHL